MLHAGYRPLLGAAIGDDDPWRTGKTGTLADRCAGLLVEVEVEDLSSRQAVAGTVDRDNVLACLHASGAQKNVDALEGNLGRAIWNPMS